MKNTTTNYIAHENVIEMLELWVEPDMWEDQSIFTEIKEVVQKLKEPSCQLSKRELFLTQELVSELLEATQTSFNKADDKYKNELSLAIKDITEFQSFLEVSTEAH